MTQAHIKEQLSLHYLGALTALGNCHLVLPRYDFGTDVLLSQIKVFTFNGKNRVYSTGRSIEIQLKSTTAQSVEYFTDKTGVRFLKYDLEVKNYHDLILRKQEGGQPLVLVLVVLFGTDESYIQIQGNLKDDGVGLHFNALAYWYYPNENELFTKNVRTKRIEISIENTIKENFSALIFKKFYP